jgi:hypothetical protein
MPQGANFGGSEESAGLDEVVPLESEPVTVDDQDDVS